jgi:GntR family transcriptional repressor for pyruvate dehydrogenase complex
VVESWVNLLPHMEGVPLVMRRAPKPEITPSWEPIRRLDITSAIVERIKGLLESGQLKAGGKLPSERELAEMLGVGRPSLRQALKSLSLMGIIESRVADGTYIRPSASTGLAESLHIALLLQATPLAKVIEARTVVEVALAGMAAINASSEHLTRLDHLLAAQEVNVRSVDVFNQHDTRFHITIAEAAGNEILLAVSGVLQRLASAGRQRTAYRGDLNRTFREHREIAEQIRRRNVEGARKAMRIHLNSAMSNVLESDVILPKEVEPDG